MRKLSVLFFLPGRPHSGDGVRIIYIIQNDDGMQCKLKKVSLSAGWKVWDKFQVVPFETFLSCEHVQRKDYHLPLRRTDVGIFSSFLYSK
jgi:hypothetical protein